MKYANGIPQKAYYRVKHESGQVLLMTAIFLIAMIAMVGLVVDGGGLYFLERDAQNAVDAAVLAATYELCRESGDRNTAINRATNTLAAHNFAQGQDGTFFTIDTPDQEGMTNPNDFIEIELNAEKPNYFIRVVNDDQLVVTTSAIGQCIRNTSPYDGHAIVGTAANCRHTVRVGGSNKSGTDFVDGVYSNSELQNGGLHVSGRPLVVNGGITTVEGSVQLSEDRGGGFQYIGGVEINGYGQSPEQLEQVNWLAAPRQLELLYDIDWFNIYSAAYQEIINLSEEDAIDKYGAEAWRVAQAVKQADANDEYHYFENPRWFNPGQLPNEGIVYVAGKMGASGEFTVSESFTLIVEGELNMSGNRFSFGEPYVPGISVVVWGGGEISPDNPSFPTGDVTQGNCNASWTANFSSSKSQWNGLIYVPWGAVNISMSSSTVYGQVIGFKTHFGLAEGFFHFDNQFLPSAPPVVGLVQ